MLGERNNLNSPLGCGAAHDALHTIGHIATSRGGEMLRALRRCKGDGARRMHSLDLLCDVADGDGAPLGFVR